MRIAVLEAVCAGLCGENPPPTLLAEGQAMRRALIDDLLGLPDIVVKTVCDTRWWDGARSSSRCQCGRSTGAEDALLNWQRILEDADRVWIIAPETDALLERLVTISQSRTMISLNASPQAIRLCADKFALAQHLHEHGVPAIPTILETWQTPPAFADGTAFVIKPRDGAGSQLVRRIEDLVAWKRVRSEYRAAGDPAALRQPFITGKAVSIARWFHASGVQWFPVAEQVLGHQFVYYGGVMPAQIHVESHSAVQQLAAAAAATIPGLHGYVGFDIVLPEASPPKPVLVEINPRLTTSCLGIRRLCRDNWLAGLLVDPFQPLRWHTDRRIDFTSQGVLCEVPLP